MAGFNAKNRAGNVSTTTGTGAMTLGAALARARSLLVAYPGYAAADETDVPYRIDGVSGAAIGEFEWGVGTIKMDGTFERTTPLGGSAATPVNFSAGDKNVACAVLIETIAAWRYIVLSADHVNSTVTPTTVPELQIVPEANKTYEVEAKLFTTSPSNTIGCFVGLTWPNGVISPTAGVLQIVQSLTAWQQRNYSRTITTNAQATGNANNIGEEVLNLFEGVMTIDGSPSGALAFDLRSEVAANEVRIKAGSFIRYREIP